MKQQTLNNRISLLLTLFTGMAIVVTVGCGGGDMPELAEVTGTLTKKGEPMVGAQVEFYPDSEGAASYGVTDEEGNFSLAYSTGPLGAAIGTHKVTVIGGHVKGKGAGEPAAPAVVGEEAAEGTLAPVQMDGGSRTRSGGPGEVKGLTAVVTAEGENHIVLEMAP